VRFSGEAAETWPMFLNALAAGMPTATLGANAFSFSDLVALWITYWHFASVTRQISGTQFGNVPANQAFINDSLHPDGDYRTWDASVREATNR
jgi:hypothetical protein